MAESSENEANEEINEEVPLTKTKKPRSQKQMEAFEKVKEKRRANIEAKKQEKLLESAKMLVENNSVRENTKSKSVSRKVKHQGNSACDRGDTWGQSPREQDESSSEEEVIIVKKSKPKPKKKVRQIIIEESSSSEEEQDEPPTPPKLTRQRAQVIRPNPRDYFC